MSNKRKGDSFERDFCEMMAGHGFWVHSLANRKNGQPFDVIAARCNKVFAFDCKTCAGDRFDFSRIEYNQELAMDAMDDAGCTHTLFAMRLDNGRVFVLPWRDIKILIAAGTKSVKVSGCLPFEWWVARWM